MADRIFTVAKQNTEKETLAIVSYRNPHSIKRNNKYCADYFTGALSINEAKELHKQLGYFLEVAKC